MEQEHIFRFLSTYFQTLLADIGVTWGGGAKVGKFPAPSIFFLPKNFLGLLSLRGQVKKMGCECILRTASNQSFPSF
jgi:hypothetical protein